MIKMTKTLPVVMLLLRVLSAKSPLSTFFELFETMDSSDPDEIEKQYDNIYEALGQPVESYHDDARDDDVVAENFVDIRKLNNAIAKLDDVRENSDTLEDIHRILVDYLLFIDPQSWETVWVFLTKKSLWASGELGRENHKGTSDIVEWNVRLDGEEKYEQFDERLLWVGDYHPDHCPKYIDDIVDSPASCNPPSSCSEAGFDFESRPDSGTGSESEAGSEPEAALAGSESVSTFTDKEAAASDGSANVIEPWMPQKGDDVWVFSFKHLKWMKANVAASFRWKGLPQQEKYLKKFKLNITLNKGKVVQDTVPLWRIRSFEFHSEELPQVWSSLIDKVRLPILRKTLEKERTKYLKAHESGSGNQPLSIKWFGVGSPRASRRLLERLCRHESEFCR